MAGMTSPPTAFGSPTGPASDPPGGRKTRRTLLLVIVGIVAFVAAGAGGFVPVRLQQDTIGPGDCGSMHDSCIPALKASTLIETLKAQGHYCAQDGDWLCYMTLGDSTFELRISTQDDQVWTMLADVSTAEGGPVTTTHLAYLTWVATIPYAHDPAFSAQIRSWVSEQLEAKNTSEKANVGGYRYELTKASKESVHLSLSLEAAF